MSGSERKRAHRTLTNLIRPTSTENLPETPDVGAKWLQPRGSFELVRRLGTGGMAEVWMARRETYGAQKVVAIKLIAPHLCDSPAHRRMFETEAELSMMLSHSNIVQVFDLCRIDDRSGLVMEWIDGVNLAQLLSWAQRAERPVSFEVASFVVGELLKALAYAHGGFGRGAGSAIVHRDISPHNVLISVSGEVKLADFGIARLSSEETSGAHIRGKLRYMAPEQASGETRDPRIDLFAVGAILHELLDGRRFRGDVPQDDLFRSVVSGELPPLHRTEVPEPLLEVYELLLHPKPALRFPSATAALVKLRSWSGFRNASLKVAIIVREAAQVEWSDVSTLQPPPKPGSPLETAHRSVSQVRRVLQRPLVGLSIAGLLSAGAGFGVARIWQTDGDQPPSPSESAAKNPQSAAEQRPQQSDAAEPAPAGATAHVTFSVVDLSKLEIKVGQRQLLLDPDTVVELTPGVHALQLQDPNGGWRAVGELEFEAGKRYAIDFDRGLIHARPAGN